MDAIACASTVFAVSGMFPNMTNGNDQKLADLFNGAVAEGRFSPTFCMGTPLQRRISRICASIQRLPTDTMFIYSDYSGQHKSSSYEVFSYLVVDPASSFCWFRNQSAFRKHALPDGRRMSFKGLNDKRKLDVLDDFLLCADKINGVCFTFCMKKPDLFYGKDFKQLKDIGFKQKIMERTFIKAELAAYIIGLLSSSFQHVNWITDHDEMIANESLHDDFLELFRIPLDWYLPHLLREISIGPPKLGEVMEEDFLSIPDLISGAMGEFLASASSSNRIITPVPSMSRKSESIVSWMSHRDNLYKVPPIIFENDGDVTQVRHLTFDSIEENWII